jgi:multidrug resistance efflux pump
MWISRAQLPRGVGLPLTRKKLEALIAIEQKKTSFWLRLQSIVLLGGATVVLIATSVVLFLYFYNAPFSFSKHGWVHVRNLTPVIAVETKIDGVLENIFVSQGQIVQKGELLGSIQIGAIELDYIEAQKNFADKVLELHCLTSLRLNKSSYSLPQGAQLLIDKMTTQTEILQKIKKCEGELLRNAVADQSIEETIAALEDQFRLLDHVVKNQISNSGTIHSLPNASANNEEGTYLPIIEFAHVQRELQITRKEYLLRKLQKEKELSSAIEQAGQEIRYLDRHIRALRNKLDDNFIYASATGTVVRAESTRIGSMINQHEAVFELQPIGKEFQISIPLDKGEERQLSSGNPTVISFDTNKISDNALNATTLAVERKPNGKLEAVMKLTGDPKIHADIIFASGFKDQGEQRLPATITTGQTKAWHAIKDIIYHHRTEPIFF